MPKCKAQPGSHQVARGKGQGNRGSKMGRDQAAEHLPPQELDATDTWRFLPEELTRESGAMREMAAPSDAPLEFPRPGPGLPPSSVLPIRAAPSLPPINACLSFTVQESGLSSPLKGSLLFSDQRILTSSHRSHCPGTLSFFLFENPSETETISYSSSPRQFPAGPPLW